MTVSRVVLSAVVLAVVALTVTPGDALAQAGAAAPARIGNFYIGLGLMGASGDGGFRVSGLDTVVGRFSSQLDFPMDATYVVLEAGIEQIGPGFGVHLRYGSSGSLDGGATDTDYAWDYGAEVFLKSLAATDGENVFLTFDVSYRLFDGVLEGATGGCLDVFAGYQMQDATFDISDSRTVIADYQVCTYSVEGPVATYDMEFYGLRLGVRGELRFGRASTISGSLAVLPFVEAQGFGQWIVREKTLDHDATGWGLDALVRYEYALSPGVRLWAGAGLTRLEGTDGTDTQFRFSGRPIGRSRLDKIESDCRFFMIGGEFRF